MRPLHRREFLISGATLALSLGALGARAFDAPANRYPVQMQTLKYAAPGGADLLLDLFLPQGASGPLPVIVFLHGGGWSGGSRKTGPDFKRFFAQEGFAIASVDYRLTPSITFPKNAEDVKTAIRWLRANAATYNLDPRRVGLWGTSSGGHLAALVALSRPELFAGEGNLDQSSAVQCVLDAYGPVSFSQMDAQTQQERADLGPLNAKLAAYLQTQHLPVFGAQHHDAPESAESRLLGAALPAVPERVREASPLTYLDDQAPPFLIMHGLADNSVPHHQSVMLYEALAAHGKNVTLCLVEGLAHGFVNVPNLDEVAGPFPMHRRLHRDAGLTEWADVQSAAIFEVSRGFFQTHLLSESVS